MIYMSEGQQLGSNTICFSFGSQVALPEFTLSVAWSQVHEFALDK